MSDDNKILLQYLHTFDRRLTRIENFLLSLFFMMISTLVSSLLAFFVT